MKIKLTILIFLCQSVILNAQTAGKESIQKYLIKIDTSSLLKSAVWGCVVENVRDGKMLAGIHQDKLLIPASVVKLAVTYPAYKILGPGFQFSTFIEHDGTLHDSILHGSLYIRGGGDPTLGSERFHENSDTVFNRILRILQQNGIKQIEGGIIADAGCFDDQLIPGSWLWEDIGNYYGGGVSGLNFNDNEYSIVFQPGKRKGDPAAILRIQPPIEDLIIDNEVVTGEENSGDGVIIYGGPFDNHRIYTGTVPLGKKEFLVKGSLPDPAANMAKQLHKFLTINNISISYPGTTERILKKQGNRLARNRKILGEIKSPPLIDILLRIHEKSINLYADALLKMLGKKALSGNDFKSGIQAVLSFWKGKEVDVSGLTLADGSGLSPVNRISPATLSQMLRIIEVEGNNSDYVNTLNLAGESGDLKSFFDSGPCYRKLRGKSGYMKTVRAYAGIISNTETENYSFTIIVNHSGQNNAAIKNEIKKLLEVICKGIE